MLALELIDGVLNANSISVISGSFFAGISATLIGIYRINKQNGNRIQEVAEHTAPIADGFADRVESKLDNIVNSQDDLASTLRRHLEWHAHHEGK
jgi:hypothetical protein